MGLRETCNKLLLSIAMISLMAPYIYIGLKRKRKFLIYGSLSFLVFAILVAWLPRSALDPQVIFLIVILLFVIAFALGKQYKIRVARALDKNERILIFSGWIGWCIFLGLYIYFLQG